MNPPLATTQLGSFPHVSDRARNHWQFHAARLAAAHMPGIGLEFVVRRMRDRRFVPLRQLHAIIVRRDGEAIRVTGVQGRRVPYGVAFDNVRFEADLLRGPGVDTVNGFPRGHHELILSGAIRTASALVARSKCWANREYFDLPTLYADFGSTPVPDPDGPEIEAACQGSGLTPRMIMSRDSVIHKGRRLIPLEYVGHTDAPFDVLVDIQSVPHRQPCGAATIDQLQFCEGAVEFNATRQSLASPSANTASTLTTAA